MVTEEPKQAGWNRSDLIQLCLLGGTLIAIIISLVALYLSSRADDRALKLQISQNGMSIINGFANRDVVNSWYDMIEWSQKLPKDEQGLVAFRRAAAPMGRQLQTLAACLADGACDSRMALRIFCTQSKLHDGILATAHQSAKVPLAAAYPFYAEARAMCPQEGG